MNLHHHPNHSANQEGRLDRRHQSLQSRPSSEVQEEHPSKVALGVQEEHPWKVALEVQPVDPWKVALVVLQELPNQGGPVVQEV
jgi:hypothetical protein